MAKGTMRINFLLNKLTSPGEKKTRKGDISQLQTEKIDFPCQLRWKIVVSCKVPVWLQQLLKP